MYHTLENARLFSYTQHSVKHGVYQSREVKYGHKAVMAMLIIALLLLICESRYQLATSFDMPVRKEKKTVIDSS